MNYLKSQRGALDLVVGLLVVGLLVLAGTTIYFKHQEQLATIKATAANTETKQTVKQSSPETKATKPTTTSTFKIAELGVELTLTSDISDLTYVTNSGNGYTNAYFSTKSLAKSEPNCQADDGAIGDISRATSLPMASGPTAENTKKIGQYYYFYIGPQSVCTSSSANASMQTSLKASLEKAFQTLTVTN